MRSLRLPWRRQSDVSHTRLPRGNDHARPGPATAANLAVRADDLSAPSCAANLLGQLGIGDMERVAPHANPLSHASSGSPDSTDVLIDTLYAQYWRALADPHASVIVEWASTAEAEKPATRAIAPDSQHCPDANRDHASIDALLFGNRTLEDVFEQLNEHAAPLLDDEPVPEILRVFAPSEFRATTARHPPALPPALTRREHHALTMDSPLSAPLRKDEE